MITIEEQLAEAQAEVARLRKMARIKRQPLHGCLGGTIQKIREQQSMTIQEMARKSGVAAGLISRIETMPRPNPTLENLIKISNALGMQASAVLARWEEEQNQP